MRSFVVFSCLLLTACGVAPTTDPGEPGVAAPQRAVLQFSFTSEPVGVRLSDNTAVVVGGDVELYEGRVASLSSTNATELCDLGSLDDFAAVPATLDACVVEWAPRMYLSANTDPAFRADAGHAFLLRTAAGEAYRAIMVDVTADAETGVTTARFDYEPLP